MASIVYMCKPIMQPPTLENLFKTQEKYQLHAIFIMYSVAKFLICKTQDQSIVLMNASIMY